MASTRTRQRKLERDRYERKLVRQAQQQRRRRRIQAGIGSFLTLALIVTGAAWLAGVFEAEPEPISVDRCTWLPRDPADHPDRIDVGTPPDNPPTGGQQQLTIEFDAGSSGSGAVEVLNNISPDPCGAASLRHLAQQGFYEDTTCHQLAEGALWCGDPSGTGLGGPAYGFYAANFPQPELDDPVPGTPSAAPDPAATDGATPESDDQSAEDGGAEPLYPAGTVAFADVTGENGSQFLIFYEDYDPADPTYPLIGRVTDGLELVEAIGAAGVSEGTTEPVEEVRLVDMTVSDGAQPSAG